MKSSEIQQNVQNVIDNFSKEDFVFDLLIAYGISKTSVTRLRKGDYNLSKVDGEILYKKKIYFKVEATGQLLNCIDEISKEERILKHKPRFAILTDHKQLVAKDLRLGKNLDIEIKELPNYFDFFLPLAGSEIYNSANNDEADRNASYKMADLYDLLVEKNPEIYNSKESIHHLNIFLSRLLFCFFAEDTEIFSENSIFTNTLAQHTAENGSDTHSFLDDLFDRLDSESGKEYPYFLAKFPYVNGGLFGQKISSPRFSAKARKTLIDLGELQWKDINPDIFGSMIQAVVDKDYRSDLGMHYTSVENILKLIKPLFLDELYEEFEKASTVKQLYTLIQRISKIKFFDPACGSGNFLIITYKEIRLLEIKILQKLTDLETQPTFKWTSVQLSQFYGIEIDDFAHEIAILSLWLAEHQMNQVFESDLAGLGQSKPILPLKEAGQITHANAIRIDWKTVCPITIEDEVYIIGNPPFWGASKLSDIQKKDIKISGLIPGKVDYVSAWFAKAVEYIKNYNAKVALVSTNSICQGEQVTLIWEKLLSKRIEIDFAYPSFTWKNNAKGNAGVIVVIIGLRNVSNKSKYLFIDNFQQEVKNINAYLRDEANTIVKKLSNSNKLLKYPSPTRVSFISKSDALFFDETQKNKIINDFNKKFIRELIGSYEMLQGKKKYCLYIEDFELLEAKQDDFINGCLLKVEKDRNSKKDIHRFCKKKISNQIEYLVIPRISSKTRNYVPVIILKGRYAFNDQVVIIENPEPIIFAIVSSRMHMTWVRAVGGKMKNDYRYSSTICYNTFPFPEISNKQKLNLNEYVFAILDERAKHPSKTMAQLYNPDTMPQGLLQAHQELDTAIEQCYRLKPFRNDTERLEYLFKQYERMVND
ncbi:DNA methyltransferase [Membranihabitans marinus]|uniref:DNA methyltransferase n=1 Tax=Membranihabitans marinus TaxID=1227546 RepID=UPI001EFFD468|nr:DNA methyltransferase [Membranihabitans marinus]